MKKIINIAFVEQDSKTMNVMKLADIYENAQKNNLFYVNSITTNNTILNIFSEYEMMDKEYNLLFKIYDNNDGFKLIINNEVEFENVKYNIIDIDT